MIYLRLYLEFFKVGLFSVGGGLATLPFLYDISTRTGWFSYADIANMIAVSESTPGPIGVNMATYAGYTTGGIPGGFIATLGLISPAIVVITIVYRILHHFKDNPYVESAFFGLRPASIAMISAAGIGVAKISLLDLEKPVSLLGGFVVWKAVLLGAVILVMQKIFPKWHPVVFIAIAAAAGIFLHLGT